LAADSVVVVVTVYHQLLVNGQASFSTNNTPTENLLVLSDHATLAASQTVILTHP
jgi:hypothetical protein